LNPSTLRRLIPGPAGSIEIALDLPSSEPKGLAVVAHPHPLFGGSLDNKVAQTLARAVIAEGMICLRPNFRGAGQSEGVHDHGQGEVDDLWAAWDWLIREYPQVQGRRWMGGFSFGAVMTTHVAHQWPAHTVSRGQPELDRVVLVGLGISEDRRAPETLTAAARLIHGEHDEVISLSTVTQWAQPQHQPVLVIPGAGHFFHGQLPMLKTAVRWMVQAQS
jgi:alpha/beta superfamily hydrolase